MKFRSMAFLLVTIMLLTGNCKNTSGVGSMSFDNYKIADGFKLELAASEPFIQAPVWLDFDNHGRMWIAEMRGFMPNLAGTGDDAPSGRISILEDKDKDGYAETYKLFLDSLVLPRSLSLVYDGVLFTAPPYLWFVEIKNDKPGKKTLVDSTYAEGGSHESQANGLM